MFTTTGRHVCDTFSRVNSTDERWRTIVADMPLIDAHLSRVAVVNDTIFIFYNQGDVVMFKEGEQPAIVGSIPKFDHFGVVSHSGKILIDGSFGNQSSTVLFDPTTFEITPFSRTVKMALCNFYCMGVVMSKNILNTC